MNIQINSPFIKMKDVQDNFTLPVVVKVIGHFDELSAAKLYDDCDRAVRTGQKVLPIFIDSYGGQVYSLMGMLDYFQSLRNDGVEVLTIACGKAMSCGALLFAMGDKRYVGQRSTIMFHRVWSGSSGNSDEIRADSEETERLEKSLFEEVSKQIGKPKGWMFDQLKKRNFTDWYISPKDAVADKIATHIGIPQFTFNINTEITYR